MISKVDQKTVGPSSQGSKSPYGYALKIALLFSFIIVLISYTFKNSGQRQTLLLLLGLALGATLYWATFSFANGWRRTITERKSIWLRAQMVMLVVASILILPAIASGSLWGNPVFALVRPIGISLIAGAFMFGIGMQIAGSCASGTLYHVGGGQARMIVVLIAFAVGALLATAQYTWWMEQPNFAPIAFIDHGGLAFAILVNIIIATCIFQAAVYFEKRQHGKVELLFTKISEASVSRSLLIGGLLLAGLNFLTVAIAGRPWSVANAFPLWGAKASQALGLELDIDFWDYWSQPAMETALSGGLLDNMTSVMNIGIMLGALSIAIGLKRINPVWRIPFRHLLAAMLGGLMLGYGATIAFGCNIGAFFGGVVSGSLHGWVWFIAAFAGTAVGILLRPIFNLPVENIPA